mmetsp:Transcript_6247/g.14080  ORF Transcript_6247/g.14080 Transcript_6247/m.14080 type:complete len:531 (-) Transcript_6247:14-1606(-)
MFVNEKQTRVIDMWQYEKKDTGYADNQYTAVISHNNSFLLSRAGQYVEKVVRAFKIKYGIIHAEVKVNKTNQIELIEFGCRAPGENIPSIIEQISGFPYTNTILKLFLNPRKDLHHIKCLNLNIYHVFFPIEFQEGIVQEIKGVEDIKKLDSYHSHVLKVQRDDKVVASKNVTQIPFTLWLANRDNKKLKEDADTARVLFGINFPPIVSFTKQLQGKIYLKSSNEYASTTSLFNKDVTIKPLLVVRPANTRDVISIVQFAQKQKLRVSVRNGGHMSSGLSLNKDIVVDMRALNKAIVKDKAYIEVEAGALTGDVMHLLEQNKMVTPVGISQTVGITGFVLGGGLSFLSKKYGLLCDSLEEVHLITADGGEIVANATTNKALFWALKGAGHNNFGIVTKMRFKTYPEIKNITGFFMDYSLDPKLLDKYQNYHTDDNTFLYFYIFYDYTQIFGYFLGDDGHKTEKIFEELSSFGKTIAKKKITLSMKGHKEMYDKSYGDQIRCIWRSKVIKDKLSSELIHLLFSYVSTSPNK